MFEGRGPGFGPNCDPAVFVLQSIVSIGCMLPGNVVNLSKDLHLSQAACEILNLIFKVNKKPVGFLSINDNCLGYVQPIPFNFRPYWGSIGTISLFNSATLPPQESVQRLLPPQKSVQRLLLFPNWFSITSLHCTHHSNCPPSCSSQDCSRLSGTVALKKCYQ